MLRLYLPLLLFLTPLFLSAQQPTEQALIATIVSKLNQKDTLGYTKLFPKRDSLNIWRPQLLSHASPFHQPPHYLSREEAEMNFADIMYRGRGEGIHWRTIVLLRYEIEESKNGVRLSRDEMPFSDFQGYVFVRDQKTGKIFTLSIANIIIAGGKWYGGEIISVLPASTKEAFLTALEEEKKLLKMQADGTAPPRDSSFADDEDDDLKPSHEIVDRKLYKGWFDEETSVELYIRYLKGNCAEPACSWEALFKFGDDDWVAMQVSKTDAGNWLFTEAGGSMELELTAQTFTGTWAADKNGTEYEARMKEAPVSPTKIQELDEMLLKISGAD